MNEQTIIATIKRYYHLFRYNIAIRAAMMAGVEIPFANPYETEHPFDMADFQQAYRVHPWIYRCVNLISKSAAGVPLAMYREIKEGEKIKREQIPGDETARLLRKPNPHMSGAMLIENVTAYKKLNGNSYWYIYRAQDKRADMLVPLRPDRVKVEVAQNGEVIRYMYQLGGGFVPIDTEDMIHFKEFNPYHDHYGMSPLESLRTTLNDDSYARKWNLNFFKNQAVPRGALSTDAKINKADFDRMLEVWKQAHEGTQYAHKIAILEKGLKWVNIGMSQTDMDFVAKLKMNRNEFGAVYGVPPSKMNDFEEGNYANAQVQERDFWNDTMIPDLRSIAGTINLNMWKLRGRTIQMLEEIFCEFDLSNVVALRRERNELAKADREDIKIGLKTINEVRTRNNLEEVPWGNTFWRAANLVDTLTEESDGNGDSDDDDDDDENNRLQDSDEIKPFANEHACRLRDPSKYTAFRRGTRTSGESGKVYAVIYGKKSNGKWEDQAYRYPKGSWTESQARSHCSKHDGILFEPAKNIDASTTLARAQSLTPSEKYYAEWRGFIANTDYYERIVQRFVLALLSDQQRIVQARVRSAQLQRMQTDYVKSIRLQSGEIDHSFYEPSIWNPDAVVKLSEIEIEAMLFDLEKAIDATDKAFMPTLRKMVEKGGTRAFELAAIAGQFTLNDPYAIAYMAAQSQRFARKINETTWNNLKAHLTEGIAAGETNAQIAQRVDHVFRGRRANKLTIARTEVASAINGGLDVGYKQSRVVETKIWVSAGDGLERDEHKGIDQEVHVNAAFVIGGESLMYPGDPSGSPWNVINCRCTTVPGVRKE